MPETTTPARPATATWTHTDTRGIARGIDAARARALSKSWANDDASLADARSLVLDAFVNVSALGPTPPAESGSTVTVRTNRSTDNSGSQAWQDALMRAVVALLATDPRGSYSLGSSVRIETEDGSPAGPPEAGFPFLAAIALVAIAGAVAAVLMDWLDQRNQIEAIHIATDAKVQEHAATLASANQILDAHSQREQAAGATLPYSTEELNQLDALRQSTKTLTEWKAPALHPGPVGGAVGAVGAGVGQAAQEIGHAAAPAIGAGLGIGEVILFSAIGWTILQSNKKPRPQNAAA